MQSISSLPMPRATNDSDDEDSALGLVLDRSTASSTVSLQPDDREELTRVNADLRRKLMDAEKTLQNRLSEHESELEEFQGRLEEMRSELSATKREEKELRSKEVGFVTWGYSIYYDSCSLILATKHYPNWCVGN